MSFKDKQQLLLATSPYNFSLGCRTSMVHQNTTHPSIPYPYKCHDPSCMPYFCLQNKNIGFQTTCEFPCSLERSYNNIKKTNWAMVWTPRYLPYMHMIKTHQLYLEHLPYWWCDGAGNNRIDIKWPKIHMLQNYLTWYGAHTRYVDPKYNSWAST